MMTENMNPLLQQTGKTSAQPELMLAAVLHLMSHYTVAQQQSGSCIKLASVIERHLKALAVLPDLAPVLRATCQQLVEQWANMIARTLPRQEKASLFARLREGTRVS
jgi:hypothetical protein